MKVARIMLAIKYLTVSLILFLIACSKPPQEINIVCNGQSTTSGWHGKDTYSYPAEPATKSYKLVFKKELTLKDDRYTTPGKIKRTSEERRVWVLNINTEDSIIDGQDYGDEDGKEKYFSYVQVLDDLINAKKEIRHGSIDTPWEPFAEDIHLTINRYSGVWDESIGKTYRTIDKRGRELLSREITTSTGLCKPADRKF